MTQSFSVVYLDHNRMFGYCQQKAITDFTDALLAPTSIEKVRKDTLEQVRVLGLVESDQSNQISQSIAHPEELGGESAIRRSDEIFTDKMGKESGLRGAIAKKEALETILDRELPSLIMPAFVKQATALQQKGAKGIKEQVQQLMVSVR